MNRLLAQHVVPRRTPSRRVREALTHARPDHELEKHARNGAEPLLASVLHR